MTIDEQHVRVELGFQKVAANQYDNIRAEEIDVALNIAQERFIKLCMSPKGDAPSFANSQRKLDDLREVIVKNKRLDALQLSKNHPAYEDRVVFSRLPDNYMFLVSDRSVTVSRMEGDCLKRPNAQLDEVVEFYAKLRFDSSKLTECPYYREVRVLFTYDQAGKGRQTVSLFDISQTSFLKGTDKPDERFEIIRLIEDSIINNVLGLRIGWEKLGDQHTPSGFVAVSTNPEIIPIKLEMIVDGETVDAVFDHKLVFQKYRLEESWQRESRANRLTDPKNLYDMLQHPFGKTRRNSPLSMLSEDKLYVYEGKDFLISQTLIDYIRYPRRLSKKEQQSCELAEHTHQEIVDLAIEYLQVSTGNPNYQLKVTDTNLRS